MLLRVRQHRRADRTALAAVLLYCLASGAEGATPPGTSVVNTAFAHYAEGSVASAVSSAVGFETAPSPPSDIVLDGDGRIASGVAGALIGAVTVLDVDLESGDSHTLSVDDPRFEVVGGVLRLRANVALDSALEPTVSLAITAVDEFGLSLTRTFELDVGAALVPSRRPPAPHRSAQSRCDNGGNLQRL